ncbi:MAG: glycoside hydrolase family 57 protein [bacterium]
MVSIIFYFQVHQPFRLKNYNFFDIGKDTLYFDDVKNREVLLKVAQKCYLPTNKLLLSLIKQHEGRFKLSFSITGTVIEQFKEYAPEVLDSFKALVDTGCVEILSETFYHSLAFLYSKSEFIEQVLAHKELIRKEFSYETKTFRNTELIYNNALARTVNDLGFKTILAEGADHVMDWRSPNYLYSPKDCPEMTLLTKNYQLSDDIAFRFSNQSWEGYPLTSEKFAGWTHQFAGNGDVINLFMDYETFGEHQWKDTGIFNFLEHLPSSILRHSDFQFLMPHEAGDQYSSVGELDVHHFISWADEERDLSAWRSNPLQFHAFQRIYALEQHVMKSQDIELIHMWRLLQTSDHFYYMCTKFAADGDVHKYFSPYGSPYDAYIAFQNVLADFETRVANKVVSYCG